MKLKIKNFGELVAMLKAYRKDLDNKLKAKDLSDKDYFVDHIGLELLSVIRAYSYTRLSICEGHINNYPLIKVVFEDALLLNLAKKDYFPPEVYQVYRFILSENVKQGSRFLDEEKIQQNILPILQKFGLQEKDLPYLLKNPSLLYLINEKDKNIKTLFDKSDLKEDYSVYASLGKSSIGAYFFPLFNKENAAYLVQSGMIDALKEFVMFFGNINKNKEEGYDPEINKNPMSFFVGKKRRAFVEHLMRATAPESFSTVFYSDFHHNYIENLGDNINWITAMNYFHEKLLPGLIFVKGINNSLTHWGPIRQSEDSWELEYRLYAWTYSSFMTSFLDEAPKESPIKFNAEAAYNLFFKNFYRVDKETYFDNLQKHLTYAFSKNHEDLMTLFARDYRKSAKLNNMDYQIIKDSYRLGQTLLFGGQFTYSYADGEEEDFSKLAQEMEHIWKKDMEQYSVMILNNDAFVKDEREREDLIMEFHSIPLFNPIRDDSKEVDEFFRKSFLSSELVRDFYNLNREEKDDSDDYEGFYEDLKMADDFFEGKKEKRRKQPKNSRKTSKQATQKES